MTLPIEPQDEYNRLLESRVHPRDWLMPTARSRYHLVVIGAGPAGLVAAAGAAGLGARVAIVERAWMGGDCLNVGCVPSKALLSSARVAALVRDSERHGIANTSEYAVNFGAIMTRMRRLRSSLSVHDSAARFRDLGIDVFLGQGRFIDSDTVDVEGQKLHFRRAVIATGARAAAPPIPGIEDAGYLTNETIFSLTELPQRLVVIGGGPIGCEMAQAFARFGSEVTQIEQGPHVLPREEPEAASLVQHALVRDGVRVLTNAQVTQLRREHNTRSVTVETQGTSEVILADQILVAAGRIANTDHMGLEQAGVQYDSRRGIEVDDFLRTTNSRIFAAGDVCSRYQFTHAADAMARVVIQNALFRGRKRISSLQIPWCTYTSPELAHIGLSPAEALMRGLAIDTFTQPLAGLDRAVVAEETDGFVRVYVRKGTDQIVGATIVAGNAGDLMGEVALAITHKMGLRKLATTIHPYPTHAEAFRKLGDQYNRTRLTPWIQRLLKGWMNLNIGAAE